MNVHVKYESDCGRQSSPYYCIMTVMLTNLGIYIIDDESQSWDRHQPEERDHLQVP